jgi:hypothetical protein
MKSKPPLSNSGKESAASVSWPAVFAGEVYWAEVKGAHGQLKLFVQRAVSGWEAYIVGARLWKTSAVTADQAKLRAEQAARSFAGENCEIRWEQP